MHPVDLILSYAETKLRTFRAQEYNNCLYERGKKVGTLSTGVLPRCKE